MNAMAHSLRRLVQGASIVCLACALLVLGVASTARAAFESAAEYVILMDHGSGAVLYQKQADVLVPPASMSKLMTVAVVCRALREGKITLDTTYKVSVHAWRTGGAPSGTSAMFAVLGSEVKVSDLLRGMIIQSGNDAAIIIAEGLAGSEDEFAKLMVAEARRIGLKKATFGNPSGLPNPNQLMTVKELAQLARFLIRAYPEYYPIFGERQFDFNNGKKTFKFYNRNPLLALEIGVDGLKTGHIKDSGYGLVASARQLDRRLIVVVAGTKSENERTAEAKKLLEWGFRSFKEVDIFDPGEIVGSARVWGGSSYLVPLVGENGVKIMVPRTAGQSRFKATIVYDGPLKPPIKKGDQVAILRVVSSDSGVNEVALYAGEDIDQAGIMARGLDSLVLMAFGWLL